MESCQLAELNYAIVSRTGRKTKKLWCSKLFLLTVSKHGLLDGYTFLFQYSSLTHTPLESSRLGELKDAISARQDVILKNKSIRKCKKRHCADSVHGHCIVDRFGQVWFCCFDISARIATKLQTRTKNLPGKVLKPISISQTYQKWWKQPFVTLQLA